MGGLSHLNLLVVIHAHVPPDVRGDARPPDKEFRQWRADHASDCLKGNGTSPLASTCFRLSMLPPERSAPRRRCAAGAGRDCPSGAGGAGVVASLCVLSRSLGMVAAAAVPSVHCSLPDTQGSTCLEHDLTSSARAEGLAFSGMSTSHSGWTSCEVLLGQCGPLPTETTCSPWMLGSADHEANHLSELHSMPADSPVRVTSTTPAFPSTPSTPSTSSFASAPLAPLAPSPRSAPSAPLPQGGHGTLHAPVAPVSLQDASSREAGTCSRSCPDMVWLPRNLVDMEVLLKAEESTRQNQAGKVVLVMSRDNVAALAVIASLSILGAIYLWKICTRKHCSCRICRGQYRTLHQLGEGGYGSVYLVERLGDGQRFVSKKILIREITEVDEYSREAKELVTLRHRHIVSYEDDFVHVEYGALEPKTYFMIIMEYCPEGDLKEKIEVDFSSFTEDWVRTVFAQLLQAVQYLHSKNVIHRDLKSQNVFLAHDGRVRLGDFGLSRHTPTPALGDATLTHAGTDCYMAPEMLSSSRYGKPADIWSLGCVLYELCTGQFMWELEGILGAMVMKDPHAVQKLIHTNMVPCIGGALTSLLKRLLSVNPASRPTAASCMKKKLFKRGFPLSRLSFGESLGDEPTPSNRGSEQCDTRGSRGRGKRGARARPVAAVATDFESDSDSEDSSEDTSNSESAEDSPAALRADLPRRRRRWRAGRR